MFVPESLPCAKAGPAPAKEQTALKRTIHIVKPPKEWSDVLFIPFFETPHGDASRHHRVKLVLNRVQFGGNDIEEELDVIERPLLLLELPAFLLHHLLCL